MQVMAEEIAAAGGIVSTDDLVQATAVAQPPLMTEVCPCLHSCLGLGCRCQPILQVAAGEQADTCMVRRSGARRCGCRRPLPAPQWWPVPCCSLQASPADQEAMQGGLQSATQLLDHEAACILPAEQHTAALSLAWCMLADRPDLLCSNL